MAETYSPDWIAAKITGYRNTLEASLTAGVTEGLGEKLAAALIFSLCLLMLALPIQLSHFYLYFLFAAMMAVYRFFISSRFSGNRLLYFGLWLACLGALSWKAGSPAYFAVILAGYLNLWLAFTLLKGSSHAKRLGFAVALSLIYFFAFTYLIQGPASLGYLQLLRPQRFLLLILMPLMSVPPEYDGDIGRLFFRFVFFPMNFIYQIPFVLTNWAEAESPWKSKIRGCFDILIGAAFLFIFYFTSKFQFSPHGFLDYVRFGTFSYVETYILSCGSISIPVGMARLFGYNMDDAYVLPLLASSPFERWRRWNTYYYRFYSLLIFFPLARRLKSLFIPIMVTFALTILFHSFSRNLTEFLLGKSETLPLNLIWFFLGHGLAVYISLRWKFKFYDGSLRKGWLGVLVDLGDDGWNPLPQPLG